MRSGTHGRCVFTKLSLGFEPDEDPKVSCKACSLVAACLSFVSGLIPDGLVACQLGSQLTKLCM